LVVAVLGLAYLATFPEAALARQVRPNRSFTTASWYGEAFKNRRTASGARFDPSRLVGAHRTLPLGSRVRVTEPEGGKSVIVTIVDRGPFIAGRGIDLSYAAARRLGIVKRGIARVAVEVLSPTAPPLLIVQAAHPPYTLPGAILE
jgi:rare lipoprotein A